MRGTCLESPDLVPSKLLSSRRCESRDQWLSQTSHSRVSWEHPATRESQEEEVREQLWGRSPELPADPASQRPPGTDTTKPLHAKMRLPTAAAQRSKGLS